MTQYSDTVLGPPSEQLVRQCMCTGLLIKVSERAMNNFTYMCVACNRFHQSHMVEYWGPLRRYIVR